MAKNKRKKSEYVCPGCGLLKNDTPLTIQLGPKGAGGPVVFHACGSCLTHVVMQHKIFVANEHCVICGEDKVPTLFEGGERMECSMHVNARRLLTKAANRLDDDDPVGQEIRQVLGVR